MTHIVYETTVTERLCTNKITYSKMSGMCVISSQDIFRHARGQTGRIKFLSIAKKLLAGKTLQCSGIYPSRINRDYDDV